VESVCAIEIPDPYRINAVKAIVVPSADSLSEDTALMRNRIMDVCGEKLIAYARPVEIEFRESLPKTLVGKIDYVLLEKQELEKRADQKPS
jgi:long-chain acyl-CoA synthetase